MTMLTDVVRKFNRTVAVLAVSGLALTIAGPAAAKRTITYSGNADIRSFSSDGRTYPGLLDGNYNYSAVFYYDDALEMTAGSLRVDGVTRKNFFCPPPMVGLCSPLSFTPVSIASAVGFTPEDGMTLGVFSPSQFGGVALLGPAHALYLTSLGDDSSAFFSWAIFDNSSGFAYNDGSGTVDRIESAVPEPASWALMIAGFGLVGIGVRRQRTRVSAAV